MKSPRAYRHSEDGSGNVIVEAVLTRNTAHSTKTDRERDTHISKGSKDDIVELLSIPKLFASILQGGSKEKPNMVTPCCTRNVGDTGYVAVSVSHFPYIYGPFHSS
jgi:hypothetical protein